MKKQSSSPANIDLLFCGNECNLACRHCFYKEHRTVANNGNIESDLEVIRTIIEKYRKRHRKLICYIKKACKTI
jgi:sulfatase maturation enzyme AslB (radical SAM superfamily)